MYKDSVIPIYIVEKNTKKFKSVGSAMLISHRAELLIITAAHVLESVSQQKSFIYLNCILYEVLGLPSYTSNCTLFGDRSNDPIDLAVMPIIGEVRKQCDKSDFITIDEYLEGEQVNSKVYQAIGYPHRKNSKFAQRTARKQGEFYSEALRYTVFDIGDYVLPYKNFVSTYHIATCLTKTGRIQGTESSQNIPDLHGTSGGLLQKVARYNEHSDNYDQAFPAGIILEKKKDSSAFFSLKLSVVFEWLDLHWEYIYEDLNSCIQNRIID